MMKRKKLAKRVLALALAFVMLAGEARFIPPAAAYDETEFWIDDVVLYGVRPSDFAIKP